MPAMGARLLGMGERRYGATAIRVADQQSRAWLVRNRNPYLDEIEAIAARVGQHGAFMLNLSFECICTASVGTAPAGQGARQLRTPERPPDVLAAPEVCPPSGSPLATGCLALAPGCSIRRAL